MCVERLRKENPHGIDHEGHQKQDRDSKKELQWRSLDVVIQCPARSGCPSPWLMKSLGAQISGTIDFSESEELLGEPVAGGMSSSQVLRG